jgi:tetratricopeptide (TPR) repeat protein
MVNKRRLAVALGLVGAAALGTGLFLATPAEGQLVITQPAGNPPKVLPKSGDGGTLSSQFSAIKLVENSNFRQYLNVARDCIKDKAWQDAVTALQTILDNKEDFYAQVTEVGRDGKKTQRWTSVKFEANNLLGSMPEEGLDVYEQRFGAPAKNKLADAKATGNRELLAEVAQRFLHTKAGIEANDLLATYFLDRGQFFMAALRFEKLFGMNPERVKIDDLTLFKAALSYRRAGDVKNADATWRKLEPRLREKGGLKLQGDLVAIAKLQQVMDETPRPESSSPFDWPYIRGNESNSAQAQGSPPLLDVVLFQRDTIKEKAEDGEDEKGTEARARIDSAIAQQSGLGNTPILPGFFPIASNNLLVYRSYHDVRAVYLQDEKDAAGKVVNKAGTIAWKTTDFDGALANVLADGKLRVTLEAWLTRFGTAGFSSLVYENTLAGTLSTDHRYVYAVDDLAVPAPGDQFQPYVWNSGQVGQEVKPLVMQNTLYAFNLRLGNCIWKLGPGGTGGKDDPFADSHFLGAPMSVGGKLYVLNEKNPGPTGDSELRLVCIDPYKMAGPGRPTVIEPVQSLGMVLQQNRITHDISRRTNAVHLAYGEGILVCPTNAGEVLGVDLLTRSLAWAYPYREQMPTPVPFLPINQPQPIPRPQMNFAPSVSNWHSAPPVIQEGKVVFTAPDANSVHCINLRDGTPVWKKKQSENDLYLAGVFGGKVLIVGKTAVRALSLEDGRQLWYVPTGDLPSGQGVASKNVYYLPLKKGEIMALDIDKGTVKAHNRAKNAGVSPGNLVFYEGAVISQTPTQIIAYPQLAARLQLAHVTLKADPDNPAKLLDYGELLLADGQVRGAVDDLKKALALKPAEPVSGRARLKLYEALTDLLTLDFPGAASRYLDEYRELCKVPENQNEQQMRQARYFRIVGQGREAQGNLVEAFQMYREFGSLPIHREQGGIASLDDPSHKVPTNVWLRGRVSAMIAKATPEEREPLERKIAEEWRVVEAKKDVDAIRSFVGMFDVPFTVGREARLKLAETIMENNDRPNFLEAELSLYQMRGPEYKSDPKSGGRALAALAQLGEKKGSVDSMKLAAAYYRELNRDFGKAQVRTEKNVGLTGSDLFNEFATDPRFLPYLEEAGSPFGDAKIAYREIPVGHFNGGLQGFIFQPEGDLTPLMKQNRLLLDASNANHPQLRLIDLTNNNVRWTQTLGGVPQNFQYFQYLYQQGQANNAYYPNAKFRFYQVKGNLVVFQVGTVAYCLDADNAKILWQQSLMEAHNQAVQPGLVNQQVLPDRDGYLEVIMWNQFNGQRIRAPIGHVGAVQASYVALVTQKGLMVLDPIRGTLLWKKMDVHPSTRVFGDENYLYLVEASEGSAGTGRVLRASDGMEIPAPDFGGIHQHRVKLLGRRILAAIPDRDHLVLKLYDIPLGKDVWIKNFDPKSVVLQTEDPDLTGVIEPDGKVIALEAQTGRELLSAGVVHGRVTPDDLKGLKDPMLLSDADRFYVALNRPIDPIKVSAGVLANNFQNGLRCATVNGWFVALHRHAGQRKIGDKTVAWKAGDFHWHSYTPIQNQMIVLEQFDQMPVILFTARYNELINGGAGGNRWVSTTQSIHKRSGKMVYDPGAKPSNSAAQFYAFNLDLKNGTINMIGFTGTIQHYIDDGRKPADVPGTNVGAALNPYLDGAFNPYGPVPQVGAGIGNVPVAPFGGVRRIMPAPRN